MIPPLSIQTLVENAVNHGVLKQITGGTVTIRMKARHGYTEIVVADDGVGMDEEQVMQLFNAHLGKYKGIVLDQYRTAAKTFVRKRVKRFIAMPEREHQLALLYRTRLSY